MLPFSLNFSSLPHAKEFWMGTELLVLLEEKSPSNQEIARTLYCVTAYDARIMMIM